MPKTPTYWTPPHPPLEILRRVDGLLAKFFDCYQVEDYEKAESAWFDWYGCLHPETEFFRYIDGGRTGGRTYENGKIHLQHPEDWKRSSNVSTKRRWIRTVVHEWGHYLLWSHAEEKAEKFEREYASLIRQKA